MTAACGPVRSLSSPYTSPSGPLDPTTTVSILDMSSSVSSRAVEAMVDSRCLREQSSEVKQPAVKVSCLIPTPRYECPATCRHIPFIVGSNDDSAHFLSATYILYGNHCNGYALNNRAITSRERTVSVSNATKDKKQTLKWLPSTECVDDEQILHQTAIGQLLQVKDTIACTHSLLMVLILSVGGSSLAAYTCIRRGSTKPCVGEKPAGQDSIRQNLDATFQTHWYQT